MMHFIHYITRDENLPAFLFTFIVWTLAWIAGGIAIGIALCSRSDKKIKNAYRNNSFDDLFDCNKRKPAGKRNRS